LSANLESFITLSTALTKLLCL